MFAFHRKMEESYFDQFIWSD